MSGKIMHLMIARRHRIKLSCLGGTGNRGGGRITNCAGARFDSRHLFALSPAERWSTNCSYLLRPD